MSDKTWKKVERDWCRELGGERRGPTGRDLPDCDDCVKVGLEIKSYKKLVFLTKDWEQAVRNAEKLGLPPVLAVREGGRNGRKRVQLRLMYFNYLVRESVAFVPYEEMLGGLDNSFARIAWDDFVRLYRAAYHIDNKENV